MSRAVSSPTATAPSIPLAADSEPDDATEPYARSVILGIVIGIPATAVLFALLAIAAGIDAGADTIGIAVFAAVWVGLLIGGVAGVGAWSMKQEARH